MSNTEAFQAALKTLTDRGIVVGAKVTYRDAIGMTSTGFIREFYGTKHVVAVISHSMASGGTATVASDIIGLAK